MPLLDRIDIHVEVPRVDYEKLSSERLGELSEMIRQRVQVARNAQSTRFSNIKLSFVACNADMREAPVWGGEIHKFCKLDETGENLIQVATWCCV